MTPRLLAALRPHVTIFSQGRFDPALADPVVRAAAHRIGDGGASNPSALATSQGTRTVTVVAEGLGAGRTRATRRAVLRLGLLDGRFQRILVCGTGP